MKTMLKIEEMVEYLDRKNIKFNYINKENAEEYLKYKNNYYNVVSYKNNFQSYIEGDTKKYANLDFSYLIDLSVIDYRLRIIIIKMILSVEHYLKIKILLDVELIISEDGYNIVNKYLKKDYKDKKKIHNNIFNKIGNEIFKKIVIKYNLKKEKLIQNIPIWEFLELITFGELIKFYEYFCNEFKLEEELKDIFILREIVKLRNAVAHNNNILNDIGAVNNKYTPDLKVKKYLNELGITKESMKRKLSNNRIRQITYLLYYFNIIVTSDGVKENVKNEVANLFYKRIILNKEYYNNNELLKSVYNYFNKIIKIHYIKM